jgi:capsular exopolysaccharide synthesis family protein
MRSFLVSIPPQEQMTLLTDYDTESAYSIAFQKLYANISFTWDREQTKQHTMLLATPTPYVGQETAATNVAIVAAQSGTPTILVDANLHRPTLEQRFGVGKHVGLSDLLTQKTPPSIAETLCDTFVPNLRLLPAGTASLQEISLLYSKRLHTVVDALRTFLAQTEREPGIVIFNSPAVLSSTEAALISDTVDQTLLTLVAGRTTRRQAKKAQEQLQHTHGTLIGVVMLDM